MYAQYASIIIIALSALLNPYLLPLIGAPTSVCPNDFVHAGNNVCLIQINQNANYCNAHKICEQEGLRRQLRLFIPARHSSRMYSTFSNLEFAYTSWSATLNRSSNLRAGWRVGDPGYADLVTNDNDQSINWADTEPNVAEQAVALYKWARVFDEYQAAIQATSVICEISSHPTGRKVERFQANWPHKLASFFATGKHTCGCFNNIMASTLLQCASQ